MKKAGCLIMVIGLVAVGVSISLFGVSIFRAVNARKVVSTPLQLGAAAKTDLLDLNTQHCGLVAVRMDVSGKSVQSQRTASDAAEYHLNYEFPVLYKVLDDKGEVIASEKTEASSKGGTVITTNATVTADGGKATVEHSFEKFNLPGNGKAAVEVQVMPDTSTGAKARNAELIVYDNVYRHGKTLAGGVGLACIAPVLVLLGLVLFIVGLASGRKKTTPG